jgi:uncharacterized protein (TIGR01319 family)
MANPIVNADSLLAVDVGAVNTRATLFDVVEGRYRFVAQGIAPTTAGAPFRHIAEGVRLAVDRLQEITGRMLLDPEAHLITPSQSDGSGVDACVATISATPPLKAVAVGLLEDVSVESAQNLASNIYAQVVETISLNDKRKPAARLDAILRPRPDVIIVAGGTEGGASQSVMSLIEIVGLACYASPPGSKPEVLYVGNQTLEKEVQGALGKLASLHVAPNIRPTLETEQLAPAMPALSEIYKLVSARKIQGVQDLSSWAGGKLMATANAYGRTIRLVSKYYDPSKGVLGVDIGAAATTVAAAFNGDLYMGVYPRLGLGESLANLHNLAPMDEIMRWLPVEISESTVREFLYNKAAYPGSVPMTAEELALEQSLVRIFLQLAVRKAIGRFPKNVARSGVGQLPWFEPIIASGSALTNAPERGQSMLMLLDALQPVGITTVALDQNNLAASLGAAGAANPALTVQSLEAGAFTNLGTVIAPVGVTNYGAPCLKVRVTYESGSTANLDVKYGALEAIRLPVGQQAKLQLQPARQFDVGMGGVGRGGAVTVYGGALGLLIDARGRPLRMPADQAKRRDLNKKWLSTLSG